VSAPGEVRYVPDVVAAFVALLEAERPRVVALSGGDTARRCYEATPSLPEATVLLGDERWVPPDNEDSNERMIRAALLDRAGVADVRSVWAAGATAEEAADAYDAMVKELGAIDLNHLGLGEDAHTASLFPGSPALDVTDRDVVATGDDLHPHRRVTLTFPGIARSRLAVVTVEGEAKREAWRRVRDGDPAAPAARLRAERLVWLVGDELRPPTSSS
jgi:6-phosphogluconolactonase